VGRMFKLYKNQLEMKHQDKFLQFLDEEGWRNDDEHLPMDHRQDLFEKLLLEEVEGNSKK